MRNFISNSWLTKVIQKAIIDPNEVVNSEKIISFKKKLSILTIISSIFAVMSFIFMSLVVYQDAIILNFKIMLVLSVTILIISTFILGYCISAFKLLFIATKIADNASKRIICPNCQSPNEFDSMFCNKCGESFEE